MEIETLAARLDLTTLIDIDAVKLAAGRESFLRRRTQYLGPKRLSEYERSGIPCRQVPATPSYSHIFSGPCSRCPVVLCRHQVAAPCDGILQRSDGRPRHTFGNAPWGASRTPRRTFRRCSRTVRKCRVHIHCCAPSRPRPIRKFRRSQCRGRCSAPSISRRAPAGTPWRSGGTPSHTDCMLRRKRQTVHEPSRSPKDEAG